MTDAAQQQVRRYGHTIVHKLRSQSVTGRLVYRTRCGQEFPCAAAQLTAREPTCRRCSSPVKRPPGFGAPHLLAPVYDGRAQWDDAVPVRADFGDPL